MRIHDTPRLPNAVLHGDPAPAPAHAPPNSPAAADVRELEAAWRAFQASPRPVFTPGPSLAQVSGGGRALELGSAGPAVSFVQTLLGRAGRPVVVDGLYGPKTEAAVRAFQESQGLEPTGRVDARTLAALRSAPPHAPRAPAPRDPHDAGAPAPAVTAPKAPVDPFVAMAHVYDLATARLAGYTKGQNPAFDRVVIQMRDAEVPLAFGDPGYDALMQARARFSQAASRAGF